jgi:hypothetical protein
VVRSFRSEESLSPVLIAEVRVSQTFGMRDTYLVPRFRNNVMVFGPGLLPQWEAWRWSRRSLSLKEVSQAWSPPELPP